MTIIYSCDWCRRNFVSSKKCLAHEEICIENPDAPKTIGIEYTGEYPNLCGGDLTVTINDKTWAFPEFCLQSGGCAVVNDDFDEIVRHDEWTIDKWPQYFPEEMKDAVTKAVNREIPHGCCGGCI